MSFRMAEVAVSCFRSVVAPRRGRTSTARGICQVLARQAIEIVESDVKGKLDNA